MKKRGFTLIELVVVIALIAILAVTLAPRLRDQIAKAKDSKAIAVLGALRTNTEVYFAEQEQTVLLAHSGDEGTALAQLVGDLDNATQKLFNNGAGVTIAYDAATGLATTDLATGGIVPVGGSRSDANADVIYGGTVGFAFADGDQEYSSSPDGVSLLLAPSGVTDSVAVAGSAQSFDTKRKAWASY